MVYWLFSIVHKTIKLKYYFPWVCSMGRRDIGKSEAKWSPSVSQDVSQRLTLANAKTPRFTDSEDETVARQNGDRRHSNDHPRSKERPEESDATGPAQAATGAECRDSKNGAIASAGRLLTTYCPDYTTRGVLSGVNAYSCKFWEILSTPSVDHRISEGRSGESVHLCAGRRAPDGGMFFRCECVLLPSVVVSHSVRCRLRTEGIVDEFICLLHAMLALPTQTLLPVGFNEQTNCLSRYTLASFSTTPRILSATPSYIRETRSPGPRIAGEF